MKQMQTKKVLNVHSEQGSKLIFNLIENALTGITVNELIELRKLSTVDSYQYYNKVKLKYIGLLGTLGSNYKITQEIEEMVFFFMHDIIKKATIRDDEYRDKQLEFKIA
ncbi:hypothetical protein [Gracilibacillus saliphilus]|uniref:hypothetical protein n=1 Tax=Gracilibacillus saliphilus TaxID=543890 RepID=UPI0013D3A8AD|nr:hypothetical protein [Gracilibacillus saliphilus]